MRVLVLNAGSSSLKASVIEPGNRQALVRMTADWGADATRMPNRRGTLTDVLARMQAEGIRASDIDAVGHRFVHAGSAYREPTAVGEEVLEALAALVPLAPLHNGVALDAIRAALELLADVPHACAFDTGFHAALAPGAYVYPLPWHWYAEWGIRRYGFHGLSVDWAVRRSAELLERSVDDLGMIVAHLGSGCSVTAVEGGRSVATSMGLTPLEGLMMGTRAGSFDPGVMLDVMRNRGLSLDQVAEAVDHESGLVGVSGISGDVRDVGRAADEGNERAILALEIFARRAAEGIAAAATSLSRVDALVFTGGIGENASRLRSRIVGRLAVLQIEPIQPTDIDADAVLSAAGAPVAVLRVEAREDVVIAEAVAALLGS